MEKDFNDFFREETGGSEAPLAEPDEGFVPRTRPDDNDPAENYEGALFDDHAIEEIPEPQPKPKKKKLSFKKKLRRFFKKLGKLPTKTLVIFGGGLAFLLIAVILITVLLSKGCAVSKEPEAEVTDTPDVPVAEATPTLPPLEDPEEGPEAGSDGEQTETVSFEGIGKDGANYLQLNDENPIIADIQARFHELGYMDIPVIDGKEGFTTKFGPSTKIAVRAFQEVNGLEIDGMLGQTSYNLLMSDAAKPLQFNKRNNDSVFGTYIEKMQTRLIALHYLSGEPNKKFDDKTAQALKQFQAKNGLTADAIAGPMTLQILYDSKALDATSSVTATAVPTVTAEP